MRIFKFLFIKNFLFLVASFLETDKSWNRAQICKVNPDSLTADIVKFIIFNIDFLRKDFKIDN